MKSYVEVILWIVAPPLMLLWTIFAPRHLVVDEHGQCLEDHRLHEERYWGRELQRNWHWHPSIGRVGVHCPAQFRYCFEQSPEAVRRRAPVQVLTLSELGLTP